MNIPKCKVRGHIPLFIGHPDEDNQLYGEMCLMKESGDDAIRFVSERQQELLESKQKDGEKITQQQPNDDNTGITLNQTF